MSASTIRKAKKLVDSGGVEKINRTKVWSDRPIGTVNAKNRCRLWKTCYSSANFGNTAPI